MIDDAFLDLQPLSNAEIISIHPEFIPPTFWFKLGQQEYYSSVPRYVIDNGHESDGEYVCKEIISILTDYFSGTLTRYCTRAKEHKGPHVSGIDNFNACVIWDLCLIHSPSI